MDFPGKQIKLSLPKRKTTKKRLCCIKPTAMYCLFPVVYSTMREHTESKLGLVSPAVKQVQLFVSYKGLREEVGRTLWTTMTS